MHEGGQEVCHGKTGLSGILTYKGMNPGSRTEVASFPSAFPEINALFGGNPDLAR
jgi:hypothetical protein